MKKANKKANAIIIIIGNEILSGRTQDVNVATISKWLNNLGVKLEEVRIVPDIENSIIKTVNELKKKFKYVFTTGGIGPTHDDITSKSISKAFNLKYGPHKAAMSILEKTRILPLLDVCIISEDEGYRKPRGSVFLSLSEKMKLHPSDILFVGDTFDADIIGAKSVEMLTAWLNSDSTLKHSSQMHFLF